MWLLSLQQEQMSKVRIKQSLLVWLHNEMEVGQSSWVKSCVTYFWDIHPIHVASAPQNIVIQTRFKIGKGDELYHHQGHP